MPTAIQLIDVLMPKIAFPRFLIHSRAFCSLHLLIYTFFVSHHNFSVRIPFRLSFPPFTISDSLATPLAGLSLTRPTLSVLLDLDNSSFDCAWILITTWAMTLSHPPCTKCCPLSLLPFWLLLDLENRMRAHKLIFLLVTRWADQLVERPWPIYWNFLGDSGDPI